jgi:hypothetical protein
MSDIVERLRNRVHDSHMDNERLMDEAADEIESLRRTLSTLAAQSSGIPGSTRLSDCMAALAALPLRKRE